MKRDHVTLPEAAMRALRLLFGSVLILAFAAPLAAQSPELSEPKAEDWGPQYSLNRRQVYATYLAHYDAFRACDAARMEALRQELREIRNRVGANTKRRSQLARLLH